MEGEVVDMPMNVTQKLISSHLMTGAMDVGQELALKIDQTLTQDATGTIVMLELEAMNLSRVRTEVSAQYVDHNLLETDFKNPDDHLFLRSACRKFGIWYSRAGNGISHPVHMQRFGVPGKTLLGSDSHTCGAGALGMLAVGTGGLEVALAMAGEPFYFRMPQVWGVKLVGRLPDWVSAKDVILEMLRRHGVAEAIDKVIEYYGPGLDGLTVMDRHVIANMGAELGATTTVFPSDSAVRHFLQAQQRSDAWAEILADDNASYDRHEEIELSKLEPLIACPSSPGSVAPVREVQGREIYQAMIGSSANPGYRDFGVAAMIVDGKQVHDRVSFDINPTSRQVLAELTRDGHLARLIHSGARIHQTGCNGCIGMGQAPATGRISLRTVPRNFPGRSGTKDDQVYLCSPETAAASAITGVITDPRTLSMHYPRVSEPDNRTIDIGLLTAPGSEDEQVALEKGPNIQPLPPFDAFSDNVEAPVLLKLGDNISTDEIMPAGEQVLPYRSNVPEISKFVFAHIDPGFHERAMQSRAGGCLIVAGTNYGQGSSREHAAIAPRYLGLKAVIAKGFARIHEGNLINFGILPLTFETPEDWARIDQGDILALPDIRGAIQQGTHVNVVNKTKRETYRVRHVLSGRQVDMILAGSLLNLMRTRR